MMRRVLVVALLAGASCNRQQSPPPEESATARPSAAPPVATPPAPARAIPPATALPESELGLTCALVAKPEGTNRHSVSLVVESKRGKTVELRYYHPLMFALDAWVDEKPMRVNIPPIDMPVVPRTVHVAPGSPATLATPVALGFGPGTREETENDPFRMWINHAPARARVRASRAFDGDKSLVCEGWLSGASAPP